MIAKPKDINKKPLISFVIRTYFRANVLARVLESIANLNYPKNKIEVIIVIDPNDINAFKVIKEFERRHRNLKVDIVQLEVNSATRAWNIGIMKSNGEIIAVLPDDIILHPDTVNFALENLNNNVVVIGFPAISDNPSLSEKLHHWKFVGAMTRNINTIMPISFFRKSVFSKVGLYREDMGPPITIHEDWELGSRIRKHGYRILVDGRLPQLHLLHFRRVKSMSKGMEKSKSNSLSQLLKSMGRHATSYLRAYIRKNWWSFFKVLKVSPLSQLFEYIVYYLLPLSILVLFLLNPVWSLLLISAAFVYVEVNSLARRYYCKLGRRERIVYPLLLMFIRIVKAYLALVGYLYNRMRRRRLQD